MSDHSQTETIGFFLDVEGGNDEEERDLLTLDLRSELIELGIGEAETLSDAELPEGAKAGMGAVIGALSLAVLPGLRHTDIRQGCQVTGSTQSAVRVKHPRERIDNRSEIFVGLGRVPGELDQEETRDRPVPGGKLKG